MREEDRFPFDESGRFVIQNYQSARPFASFLPGIAGPMGIPMWVFYVNRGQAVASFGVKDKDHAIMEFLPANKAYHNTPYAGFRTFIKILRGGEVTAYEPFSPWHRSLTSQRQMFIGMNELELQETNSTLGLQTNVLYFTLPGESFAGLVRQVTLMNASHNPLQIELLDGMPAVIPYGVTNWELKEIARTIEAWMKVFNLENRVPFYRLRAGAGDTAEVTTIQAGHFALSFIQQDNDVQLLHAIVDPELVFGQNTAHSEPDRFIDTPLVELLKAAQITSGKTPCGFFGTKATLSPGEALTIRSIYGHTSSIEHLEEVSKTILSGVYLSEKLREARELVEKITDAMLTITSSPTFDAYCRQTLLDNVLRGGLPILLGDEKHPFVYHIYSRKHGDLERDYNAFSLPLEYYSQGNGNYRDVNQNRRNDVWFNPQIGDFNIRFFMSLIQADGYNPLVLQGTRFSIPPERLPAVLEQVVSPEELEPILVQSFTPGQLLKYIIDRHVDIRISPDAFLALALENAEQHIEAIFGDGYWIDHWTYNLDLIESYLVVYPDRKKDLLFSDPSLPFFDNSVIVLPWDKKYVLAQGKPRQFGAVIEDNEKAALIASRTQSPHLMRTKNGHGEIYRTRLFEKLFILALIKFATMDPYGMGIEMEAGKPGWYDAMNGLPGLFGSSMPETYELQNLLKFLLSATHGQDHQSINLPIEVCALLGRVTSCLKLYKETSNGERDFRYWDEVSQAREQYRASVRLGFDGKTHVIPVTEIAVNVQLFLDKIQIGVDRALELNNDFPPTYFIYELDDYEVITDATGDPERDPHGRPYICAKSFRPRVLPLFLEGPVRTMKLLAGPSAQGLHEKVKASDLYDPKLKMYKVNASLENCTHEIGRARAFTPGWLENESIWLHMEYKYLLELLRAGLFEEFYQDFENALIPFQDPAVYGRSPLENSSFIVSSAHPDTSLHGVGFVARLSGSTAEFLSIWRLIMAGREPFYLRDHELCLVFKPALPGWLFTDDGEISFKFLGSCTVTYHNPLMLDTFKSGVTTNKMVLHTKDDEQITISGHTISSPYAQMVRDGDVREIDVHLGYYEQR